MRGRFRESVYWTVIEVGKTTRWGNYYDQDQAEEHLNHLQSVNPRKNYMVAMDDNGLLKDKYGEIIESSKKIAKTIIEIQEEVKLPGTNIILEKGDKVEVLKEYSMFDGNTYQSYDGQYQLYISDNEGELINVKTQRVITQFDLSTPIEDSF